MGRKTIAHVDFSESRADDLRDLIEAAADVTADQSRRAISVALLEGLNDLKVLVLRVRASATLHVDPAYEMDSRINASDVAQEFVVVGRLGEPLVKLLIQLLAAWSRAHR